MQSRHRKKRKRGFTLVEIVVAVAIIALISAGITVAVVKIALKQKIELARANAETLRASVKLWWQLGSDTSSCPTVPMLVADGAVDKGKLVKADPWGEPWAIKCEENEATVISRGPDKTPDTEDDIRVPPT